MSNYRIYFKPSVEKDLRGLPNSVVSQVMNRIEKLVDTPFPSNAVKLTGTQRTFRIRVKDYQIIYEVDKEDNCSLCPASP